MYYCLPIGRPLKPRPGYFTRYGTIAFVGIEGRGPVLKLTFFYQHLILPIVPRCCNAFNSTPGNKKIIKYKQYYLNVVPSNLKKISVR